MERFSAGIIVTFLLFSRPCAGNCAPVHRGLLHEKRRPQTGSLNGHWIKRILEEVFSATHLPAAALELGCFRTSVPPVSSDLATSDLKTGVPLSWTPLSPLQGYIALLLPVPAGSRSLLASYPMPTMLLGSHCLVVELTVARRRSVRMASGVADKDDVDGQGQRHLPNEGP
jgi:hypothetical protein